MTEVGSVYGESLYELAKAESLSKSIGEQLAVLQESDEQCDYECYVSRHCIEVAADDAGTCKEHEEYKEWKQC